MPKRGERATPKQREALKRGQKKRADALAQAKPGEESQGERWARLLDGTLTVGELTDEEVSRSRVHGKGGVFHGEAPRLPSHLVQQFHSEQIKRAKSILAADLQKAARALGKVLDDPEASNTEIIKAADLLLQRGLGKTPETVNVKVEDKWGSLLEDGADVRDARDLSGLARTVAREVDDEAGGLPHS